MATACECGSSLFVSFRSLTGLLRSTGDIVCSYSGDGSDGFFELTAPGTSKPAFDGESDIPPSDPRSPKWHPMRKSRWDAEVTGSEATMSCIEYGVPQIGNRITVTSKSGEVLSEETVDSGGYSTYDLMVRGPLACCSLASASDRRSLPAPPQVLAFCSHVRQLEAGWVRDADAFENTGDEPVNQMKVVDAIYRASGLEPRTGPAGIAAKL